MRVAAIQLDIAWEDPPTNYRRAERRIQEAAASGANLVVLPEMFACGFSLRPDRVAEHPGGPTESFLTEVATGLGIAVIAGVPLWLGAEKPNNCAVLVTADGEVKRSAKLHPFTFAGEEAAYTFGDEVHTWSVGDLRVTALVCYDLRFPEPFRLAADRTDLFVVIANWPERRRAHWNALLRARAIENQAFVLGVNRVGDGDGLHYTGDSAIVSPWGETLASAAEQEAVLMAELTPDATATARSQFPALRDRRPGAYRLA